MILLFKAQNILNGRAPEAVDALIVVAYHADVFVPACKQRGQQILHVVGVLVFVHQHIAEFLLIIPADLLMLLKHLDGNVDDIVKVQGVVIPELRLIFFVGAGHIFSPEIAAFLRVLQHLGR